MRRVLLGLAAAVTLAAVLAGGAGGTHSNGEGPGQELVAGTGTLREIGFGVPTIHVNAQEMPGEPAHGHFFVRYPDDPVHAPGGFAIHGDVTCLTVTGNTAAIGGVVTRSKGTFRLNVPAGTEVLISIYDLGEPGDLDGANWGPQAGASVGNCLSPAFSIPISQGNYIVHNDPPLSLLGALDLQIAEFEAAAGEH